MSEKDCVTCGARGEKEMSDCKYWTPTHILVCSMWTPRNCVTCAEGDSSGILFKCNKGFDPHNAHCKNYYAWRPKVEKGCRTCLHEGEWSGINCLSCTNGYRKDNWEPKEAPMETGCLNCAHNPLFNSIDKTPCESCIRNGLKLTDKWKSKEPPKPTRESDRYRPFEKWGGPNGERPSVPLCCLTCDQSRNLKITKHDAWMQESIAKYTLPILHCDRRHELVGKFATCNHHRLRELGPEWFK